MPRSPSPSLGLHRHDRCQHGEPLARPHCADALAVGEVGARAGVPVRPVRHEVKPDLLRYHTGLAHHLDQHAVPVLQDTVVESRGIAGDHHRVRLKFVVVDEMPFRFRKLNNRIPNIFFGEQQLDYGI